VRQKLVRGSWRTLIRAASSGYPQRQRKEGCRSIMKKGDDKRERKKRLWRTGITGIRHGEKWLIQNQDELLSRCSSTADMSSHSHTHCLMSSGEANV